MLNDFAAWLLELLLWIPRQVFSLIMAALAALLNAIPVPGFVADLGPAFTAIFSGTTGYFLDLLQLPYGIGVVSSAYVLRFFIRRLPFIG